jgi:type IV pilus assembly protein PilV
MVGKHGVSGGFSLIEMLVATTVFSVGMSGMAALMLSAAGGMAEAEFESLAHLQADAMAATLQLSPLALEHLANPPQSAPLCFENDFCTDLDWAIGQYLLWRTRISQELPGGAGTVCRDSTPNDGDAGSPECDGSGPVVTKVFWEEPRHAHDADGGVRRAVVQVPQ